MDKNKILTRAHQHLEERISSFICEFFNEDETTWGSTEYIILSPDPDDLYIGGYNVRANVSIG